ncbi:hypothetical protein PIB30_083432 [Stylosanthes scabra]|uniref:Uncharacterized protein n=1 Tax=Stylosanthes scabra TaxID=79078 RepID=A0ABU6ZR06_9FABA|nr:hypothetical protein [Stylosanthes scabra]
MKEAEGAGPHSILPSSKAQTIFSDASASGPIPASSVPPVPSSGASKATGKSTSAAPAKPFSVEREEGVKEDPAADLRQKRRKRKVLEASAEEAALGGDSAWKHKVNPIDRAFLPDYNFRAALDAGLTNAPIPEILEPLVPEQLLGTTHFGGFNLVLDTRWDPKAKRIYNPKAEAQDQPKPVVMQPEPEAEEQRRKL